MITFNKKDYPYKEITVGKYGEVKISVESLEDELISPAGGYVSDKAQELDECIFFYVPDDKINLPDSELSNYVEKEVA